MGSIGNLGDYQRLSIAAKKVGGPANLGLLVSGVSAVIGAAAGIGFKTASDKRKTSKKKKELVSAQYTVHTSATDNQGLSLNTGDKFKVLFVDRDVVLKIYE